MTRRETVLRYFNEQKDYMEERVRSGIELYRKSFAAVRFVKQDGTPASGVSVKAVQQTHDFNFGCNMFLLDEFETEEKNRMYRKLYPKLFNYAVAPFYWIDLEPEKGKPRYAADSPKIYRRPSPDLVVDYCRSVGIRLKGHCLIYDAFSPSWLLTDEIPGIKREIRAHLTEIAERYGNTISDWDIINEALSWNCYDSERLTKFFREDDYVSYPFKVASSLPFERKFLNEAIGIWKDPHFKRSYCYLYLKDLLQSGVEIDGIGLQFHEFCLREGEKEYSADHFNPVRIFDTLDTLATLGKPLQISEITLNSYNGDEEDMEIQALLAENMYKLWFSHPAMDGIVYWNFVDGYTFTGQNIKTYNPDDGENRFGGGLLYHDLTPKPIFHTLDRLINHEWHTECELFSDNGGTARFKGFRGMYDLEIRYNDRILHKALHLNGHPETTCTIVVE